MSRMGGWLGGVLPLIVSRWAQRALSLGGFEPSITRAERVNFVSEAGKYLQDYGGLYSPVGKELCRHTRHTLQFALLKLRRGGMRLSSYS